MNHEKRIKELEESIINWKIAIGCLVGFLILSYMGLFILEDRTRIPEGARPVYNYCHNESRIYYFGGENYSLDKRESGECALNFHIDIEEDKIYCFYKKEVCEIR